MDGWMDRWINKMEARSQDLSNGWKYAGQVEGRVNLDFGGFRLKTCEAV